ncbi:class I SAM-dependent methyltransferase [Celerinatantimonas yamalensis]|uniref:Cyclopropane-fatty-acyl-phospholipid synthase family protein n=1 Tax=Celerinatantimonas yamalensis TaxID=559956 RepID=A0ABW9G6I3_9GAMM
MLKTRSLPWNWFNPRRELARNVLIHFLSHIKGARIELKQPEQSNQICGEDNASVHLIIDIRDNCVFERVLRGGSLAAAETYIEGLWRTDDLHTLLIVMAQNQARLDRLDSNISKWVEWAAKSRHWLRRNHKSQAKRNILAHYDLGNHFYKSFLDSQMQYSSALYHGLDTTHPEQNLDQAQQQKLQRICEQLQLNADSHLLEIGSGWGGLAVYAARHYGCQVTTTTISDEQYQYCCQLVHQQGLSDRIRVLSRDYRDLHGRYDRLVSIEMIEAVGEAYLPQFIQKCAMLLKPGGRMLLQSITIADERFDSYQKNTDFIQQMVFPGGFLPSMALLKKLINKYQFVTENCFDMRLSYAYTLHAWHNRLSTYRSEHPQALVFNAQFFRLWHFYMAYCEAGFLSANTGVWQITLTH